MEANIAFYCLHKLRLLPSQYDRLPLREKAFIYAAIQIKQEAEEKEEKKLKKRR